jgi:HSP20 family protein
MTEKKRKAKGETDRGLGGLSKGVGNLLDLISKMTEEGTEELTRTGEIKGLSGKAKGIYGFTVKMSLGGQPSVQQFGNLRETEKGMAVAEAQEPIVDVFDEGERLVVIAELPGVEESDIRIEVTEDVLELTAEARDRKYRKEILLPSPVEADTMESTFRNGILEIRLAKKRV